MRRTVFILLSLFGIGCSAQDPEIQTCRSTSASLPANTGATFEQVITRTAAGKQTAVCELSIVDAVAPLSVTVAGLADEVEFDRAAFEWNGTDFVTSSFGKPKDRLVVSGCNGAPPCRLTATLTTKGHTPGTRIGCAIDVAGTTSMRGQSIPGTTLGDTFTAGRGQVREKLLTVFSGAPQVHYCTLRELQAPTVSGSTFEIEVFRNQASLFGGVYAGSVANALFPAATAPAAPFGYARSGFDASGQRVKHIVPRTASAVLPDDVVGCVGAYTDPAAGGGTLHMNEAGLAGGGFSLGASTCSPTDEVCDGFDNDCDGSIDEGCPPCAPIDPVASSLTATSACLTAGTGAQSALVLSLVDTDGLPITGDLASGGAMVTMQASTGSVSPVTTDSVDYWATLTVPATVPSGGSVVVQANVSTACDSRSFDVVVSVAPELTSVGGGAGGCPADGNLRVRVVDELTGAAITGAHVMVGASEQLAAYQESFRQAPTGPNTAMTGLNGYAEFRDFAAGLDGPLTVTVAAGDPATALSATSRWYLTFADMDASDLVMPVGLALPAGTDTFTGAHTAMTTNSADLDASIVLTDMSIHQLASFELENLLAPAECRIMELSGVFCPIGNVPVDVPENVYVPAQTGNILGVCQTNVSEYPYTLQAVSGDRVLYALEGDLPLNQLVDMPSSPSELIRAMSYDRIAVVEPVASSGTGATVVQDFTAAEDLASNVSCVVPAGTGIPANYEVLCLVGFDFDASGVSDLGRGRLGLSGLDLQTTKGASGPYDFLVRNTPDAGGFAGKQRFVAAAASWVDAGNCSGGGESDCPVPGLENGVTVVIKRDAVVPVSGGSFSFDSFFDVRPLSRTGRALNLGPLSDGPPEHYSVSTIYQTVTTDNQAVCTPPGVRTRDRPLWKIWAPAGTASFELPTPPAGWPREMGTSELSGLLDPVVTPENDLLQWSNQAIHEGLNPGFEYDTIRLESFREAVTHSSTNTTGW